MILRDFPDLTWLKRQTGQIVDKNKRGNFEISGWPNVILTTKAQIAERPDVKGPLSLFFNLEGISIASVHNHTVKVDDDFFFISNQGQEYSLEIKSKSPVETFNIHFGDSFADEIFQSLSTKPEFSLDLNIRKEDISLSFFNKAYRKSDNLNNVITSFHEQLNNQKISQLQEEEFLASVMEELLRVNAVVEEQMKTIPSFKRSTRVELYRRLSMAVDYMYFNYSTDISLETLSEHAMLSRYHFLRLFKVLFKITPYNFLNSIRMERAIDLLRKTDLSVAEIARAVGFEEASSFSRTFKNRVGFYPAQYKSLIIN
jgi:AraC family transcriptional regulator